MPLAVPVLGTRYVSTCDWRLQTLRARCRYFVALYCFIHKTVWHSMCCWICVFRVVVCAVGFTCSVLWFVLLDLDVPCCVLFPASREGINKPSSGDCTPLHPCQTPFVGTGCTNICLFVNNASSCRGPLNKTSTIGTQVGVCSDRKFVLEWGTVFERINNSLNSFSFMFGLQFVRGAVGSLAWGLLCCCTVVLL